MTIDEKENLVHAWDTADHNWQESVACWFYDAAAGAGGFFRFGIHPNDGFGRFNLFAFIEAGQRFRRVRSREALEPVEGAPLAVGSCVAGVDDGRLSFSWAEEECEAELSMDEHFYPEKGFAGEGDDEMSGLVYGGHLESSGRFVGRLRVGDVEVAVDALAHRDRSWGPRDMSAVLTNRMMTGTFGPPLSFALNSIGLVNGVNANIGLVVRDGTVHNVTDYVILPSIHMDGYSVEAGTAIVRLPDGETLTITCETIEGFLNPHDDYLCSEHISVARCGDLVGFCDNELTNNPRLGTENPPFPLYVTDGDGLSDRPLRVHREW